MLLQAFLISCINETIQTHFQDTAIRWRAVLDEFNDLQTWRRKRESRRQAGFIYEPADNFADFILRFLDDNDSSDQADNDDSDEESNSENDEEGNGGNQEEDTDHDQDVDDR